MPKYIDAEKLKADHFVASTTANTTNYLYVSLYQILNAPSADVRENVHAHWEEADKYGNRRCSNCKSVEHVPTLMGKPIVWEFCPNCGAVMDERREEDGEIH